MKNLKLAGIGISLAIGLFCSVVAYYYIITPLTAVVVSSDDFPAGLSPHFTPDGLTDEVLAHLRNINTVADSNRVNDVSQQEGLGPRAIMQTVVPIRGLTDTPSPVSSQKIRGMSFDLARKLGISLKARRFLELAVIGSGQDGWQLTAKLKERPDFLPVGAVTAPNLGGSCPELKACTIDLSEQSERLLDPNRLLSFYIKTNTTHADQGILELYMNVIPTDSLLSDDFVAWGNAFYGLGQFDQALQKYQEALTKDGNSCAAHLARGYLYFSEPRRSRLLADLQQAESDLRTGVACDPKNEISHNNLCSVLLREWTNFPNLGIHRITEAKEECEKALSINPQFVVAAVNVGYILYREGQHAEALGYFDKLSQRYPTDSGLFINYGYLEYLEYLGGDKDALGRAILQTLQSWKLGKDTDRMVNRLLVSYAAADGLGFFYYEQGDYTDAIDYWAKAKTFDIGDADCIAGLALGTFKLGNQQDAVQLLSEAVKMDSHYRDPAYLKQNNSWSDLATSDLAHLITLVPVVPGN